MTTTATAAAATPAIACPDWCRITYAEHLKQLPQLDGFVIHWSEEFRVFADQGFQIGAATYIDGTPDATDPMRVHFLGQTGGDGLLAEDAEALARELLTRLAAARAGMGVSA